MHELGGCIEWAGTTAIENQSRLREDDTRNRSRVRHFLRGYLTLIGSMKTAGNHLLQHACEVRYKSDGTPSHMASGLERRLSSTGGFPRMSSWGEGQSPSYACAEESLMYSGCTSTNWSGNWTMLRGWETALIQDIHI